MVSNVQIENGLENHINSWFLGSYENFAGWFAGPNEQGEADQNGAECLNDLHENISSSAVNNMAESNAAAQSVVSCTYLNNVNEFSLAEMDIFLSELQLP